MSWGGMENRHACSADARVAVDWTWADRRTIADSMSLRVRWIPGVGSCVAMSWSGGFRVLVSWWHVVSDASCFVGESWGVCVAGTVVIGIEIGLVEVPFSVDCVCGSPNSDGTLMLRSIVEVGGISACCAADGDIDLSVAVMLGCCKMNF